jgi:hypothetical protein
MKNLFVLPTDKPSRLVKFFTNKFHLCKEILPIQDEEQYQNIYITSDEKIKEGDWYITVLNNEIYKADSDTEIIMSVANKCDNTTYKKTHFKIILTTDQDLDGVQAIDDEFLEWFVKNPSCEEVEITKGKMKLNDDGEEYGFPDMSLYKIIIPNEEITFEEVFGEEKKKGLKEFIDNHKQNLIDMMQDDEKLGLYEEPKQRLEKYSERFDNKENEIVQGIFNPENWGNRLVNDEPKQENCCTPIGKIKRYVDCKGCDRKPSKLKLTQLSKNVDDALDKETKESMSQWLKEKREQQETIEEASWRFNPLKKLDGEFLRNAFVKGAKSDAARDYWFSIFKEQFKKK